MKALSIQHLRDNLDIELGIKKYKCVYDCMQLLSRLSSPIQYEFENFLCALFSVPFVFHSFLLAFLMHYR